MAHLPNPFTPTFGIVPQVMAGRETLLARMSAAFEAGPGDPNLSTIIIGARGTGKTVLLSCIADEARRSGWISADVVASEGMLEDILQRAAESASEFVSDSPRRHLTGFEVAQILGIHWETGTPPEANWRTRMNALFAELDRHGIGLLITVDEVKVTVPEMVHLAATYQLFVREGRKVALVMAGLPKQVSSLVGDESVSFLRRARQHYLGRIGDAEVASAFARTARAGGKEIDPPAVEVAVEAIRGFPYMMQLVGYFTWLEAEESDAIRLEHAERGVELAKKDLEDGVLDATYRELSAGDRAFLCAMLADERESRLSDIARRMGKSNGYASSYKSRLMNQGVLESQSDGTLVFSMPFFREYFERLA